MPELDAPLAVVRAPEKLHTYYAKPSVEVREDSYTKKITVRGLLGIAPDDHTIIEWPVTVWSSGYWNRGTTRKVLAQVKKRFLEECAGIGYTADKFTEPLEISLFWER